MSKTDKTSPWRVKQHYDHAYIEEHHDHRNGVCNLPARPTAKDDLPWHSNDGSCFWWPSLQFYRSRWGKCPCIMCHNMFGYGTKSPRQRRYDDKRYCRDSWRDEY